MNIKHLPYPEPERTDVTDDYFGTVVADPYRWLEDDRSEKTAAWVAAENEVTQDYLSQIPFREQIRQRLTELWSYPWEGAPVKHGNYYYFYRNNGKQNQAVIYRTAKLGEEPEVFLDPNTLSEDGTGRSGRCLLLEGRPLLCLCRLGIRLGLERHLRHAHQRQTVDGRRDQMGQALQRPSWTPDEKGFYYSTFDVPESGVYSSQNQFQKVYHHTLGTPQSSDRLIHMDKEHPLRYFTASVSQDGKWLFITASEGTSGSEILFRRSTARSSRCSSPDLRTTTASSSARTTSSTYGPTSTPPTTG